MDYVYLNGAIAVKEQKLLKDKILRMSETTAEDAFRTLTESGFGQGAVAADVYGFESLVRADERDIDEFIRTCAPSNAEREYFLSPRDYHNAKAFVKSEALGSKPENMLAPDGMYPAAQIGECVKEEKYESLGELGKAAKEGREACKEDADGAKIGMIFERAQQAHLTRVCSKNKILKKLLADKTDMKNLLTAFRAGSAEESLFLPGGRLPQKIFSLLLRDPDRAEKELAGGEFSAFAAALFSAKREGKPYTVAERMLDGYEAVFFEKRKYDLDKNLPFLYYVFRRRAENENVRILFVCLLAGMKEAEIKARLRATGERV